MSDFRGNSQIWKSVWYCAWKLDDRKKTCWQDQAAEENNVQIEQKYAVNVKIYA